MELPLSSSIEEKDLETFLSNIKSYLTQIYKILEFSRLPLRMKTTPGGRRLFNALNQLGDFNINFLESYRYLRDAARKADTNKTYGDLKR